jgi:geranylgeranyl transferase type-2 subunit alpha
MDERNFHAWNYRIWLIRDVMKYNKKVIASELEYLKGKIEDNFSNFSAFHFRSKLLSV